MGITRAISLWDLNVLQAFHQVFCTVTHSRTRYLVLFLCQAIACSKQRLTKRLPMRQAWCQNGCPVERVTVSLWLPSNRPLAACL